MKTILSFIDWYLPGYRAGGILKAFSNQVAHLEGNFQFKIITRDTDYCETTPYDQIQSNQWNRIAANAEAFYISAENLNINYIRELVRQTQFDIVYIHGIYSFYFSILPVWLVKAKQIRTIIGSHGMLGKHSLKVKSRKKSLFLTIAWKMGFYNNIIFHAANEAEAQDIREALGKKVTIMVAEELPMKIELPLQNQRIKEIGVLKVCSIARISPEKNTLFAIEQLVNCEGIKIDYDIYGPVYDSDYWGLCQKAIELLPANVRVQYMGSIPGDQVLSTLSHYHAMYLPTTGENFGHTILESFMAATPVIISQNTPWRNLENQQVGWDLPLHEPARFSRVFNFIGGLNQDQYDEWSKSALSYAAAFMKDNSILEQNIKLFDDESN